MVNKRKDIALHIILIIFVFMTMLPFLFVINNSLRTNSEMYHSFFGLPASLKNMAKFTYHKITGHSERIILKIEADIDTDQNGSRFEMAQIPYAEAMKHLWNEMTYGYSFSSKILRPYMINTLFVCVVTAIGTILIGSITAYVFSRYRFPGHKILFMVILSMMMIPGILTLVPSFLLVKKLGLLNSYWVLILPYIAGGQIFAIFLFKGFFDGLPEALFESARLDGAGHISLYLNIVLPLSKQVIAVVFIFNVLGTWNNFLWPFITNSDPQYHVISSGLFLMGQTQVAANYSTMYSAYVLSSIPLLVLFIYGTKHFITGITAGAFKA